MREREPLFDLPLIKAQIIISHYAHQLKKKSIFHFTSRKKHTLLPHWMVTEMIHFSFMVNEMVAAPFLDIYKIIEYDTRI